MLLSAKIWPICLPTSGDSPLLSEAMRVQAFGFGVREITETERIYAEIITGASLNISNKKSCRSCEITKGDI